ncbi:MAG: PcfJ domain-containing protein [Psychromonas sp.]
MKIDPTNTVSIDLKGNLLFSIAPDYQRQFMITSWNSGMHFYIKCDEGWQQEDIDTGLMLISDENINQENEPISLYLTQMPNELMELAKPFRYRQFSLLQLIAQYPLVLDVLKHSPNLVWLLVVEAETHAWSKKELVAILLQKREVIIEKLIYKPCKKLVRFVNKIELHKGIASEFDLIKKCLTSVEISDAFSHCQTIPIQALAVAARYPYFLKTKMLESEVDKTRTARSHELKFIKYQQTVDDIKRMASAMGHDLNDRYKENISSKMALNRLHVNWITRFNHCNEFVQFLIEHGQQNGMNQAIVDNQIISACKQLPRQQIAFPICPLGDFEGVIQIKNNFELLAEGLEMRHCVGSYVEDALRENSYFYKMLSPERATAQIHIVNEKIVVQQFKLAHNKTPSAAAYKHLHELFDK